MIKRHSALTVDKHLELRGGKGLVVMENFMDPEMAHGAGRLFAKTVIPPGASIGLHKHEGESEVYYILNGRALVNDNGAPVELGPGDINYCPDGQSHGIENIGDADLEYIAVILFTSPKAA